MSFKLGDDEHYVKPIYILIFLFSVLFFVCGNVIDFLEIFGLFILLGIVIIIGGCFILKGDNNGRQTS